MATAAPTAPTAPVLTGRPRPVYTRVEALGLLVAALAPAIVLVAALLAGLSVADEIAFFGATIVVPLAAAVLVWRFGLWAKIAGIVVALAAAFMLFWMAFGLQYPSSVADFVPGVLLPLGVLVAVAGGVAAIVQQRRGRLEVGATVVEQRITAVVIGLAALALVVSAGMMMLTRTTADAADAMAVTITDFAFAEETYTVASGEPTELVVHNADPFMHTFTVPALGIDQVVPPGSDATIEITADAGTYTIYCKPHSDMNEADPAEAGMAATLVAE